MIYADCKKKLKQCIRSFSAKEDDGFSPHPSYSPDLGTADFHLGPVNYALGGRHFSYDDEMKFSVREELRRFRKEFYGTSIQRLKQRSKKCVNNEEDLVEKQTQPCKGCAQVKRKFNYDYSNSFWERIRWHYFCSVPRINVSFIRNVTSGQGTHYHHESTSVQI